MTEAEIMARGYCETWEGESRGLTKNGGREMVSDWMVV